MADNEKLTQAKEKLNVKREEALLKANEKKTNAKIKVKEKILEKKQARNEKRIESHLNLAEAKVEAALDDATIDIALLSDKVDYDISVNAIPADLIMFKAENILEEIALRTQLRVQVAKNELIRNLENDLEDALELAIFEESISELKDKSSVVITTLEGKIATEKEELKEKYGEE
ncbi:hypothetical protein [Methanobrevibacter sp.]